MAVAQACRLCGGGGAVRDATGELRPLVFKYIGVAIEPADPLPKEVCEACSDRIEEFHEFAERCLRVQAELAADGVSPDPIAVKVEVDVDDPERFEPDVKLEHLEDEEEEEEERLSDRRRDDPLDYDFDDGSDGSGRAEETPKSKRRKSGSLKEYKKKKADCNLKKFITFSCFVCGHDFENWYRLKAHIAARHRETPKVKCACGYELKSKTAIYRHVAGHNDPTCYSCDQCSRKTKTEEAMAAHKLRHVPKPDRIFSCASCPKQFNAKENLKSHERVHIPLSERYNYPCNVCGNKFTTKSAVVGHIRAVHEKVKRYICDICGYSCVTGGELAQHRAIHSEDKHFECRICKKRFKTCSNLKAHIDIHGETSYPCGVCGRVLNSRRTLRKHFLVHEDLCKHICTYCNKAFKRRQTLKVHLTTHTGDKPIQCPWCPVKFAFSSALRTHKQRVHFDKISEIKEERKEIKLE